jgi:hypothetical protein
LKKNRNKNLLKRNTNSLKQNNISCLNKIKKKNSHVSKQAGINLTTDWKIIKLCFVWDFLLLALFLWIGNSIKLNFTGCWDTMIFFLESSEFLTVSFKNVAATLGWWHKNHSIPATSKIQFDWIPNSKKKSQ